MNYPDQLSTVADMLTDLTPIVHRNAMNLCDKHFASTKR